MISSITPVVYGSHRRLKWLVAVALYSLSAALGGALTGAGVASLGFFVRRSWTPHNGELWLCFSLLALFYALHEARLWRLPLPQRARQVPSGWRVKYHPWASATLYGLFLGVGVLTRIPFSTFHLFLLWSFFVGDPTLVTPVACLFGLCQGLPLLITGWRIDSADDAYRIGLRSWSLRPLVRSFNGAVLAGVAGLSLIGAGAADVQAHFFRKDQNMRLYVVDTHGKSTQGSIEIYDATTGRRLKALPARYNPELAVSPDGRLLFVTESDVKGSPTTHHLLVYDAKTFQNIRHVPFSDRPIYNIRPSSSGILVSEDGRYVYILKAETLSGGQANYSVATYDVNKGAFLPNELKLPEGVLAFGGLKGRPDVFFALQGQQMEGVSWAHPARDKTLPRLHQFEHPDKRGYEFKTNAVGVDPDGNFLHQVTQNGRLRIGDIRKNTVEPEVQLDIPADSAVPIQHLLVTSKNFLLGTSSKEGAARGQAEVVCIFDRSNLTRLRSIKLSPPGEQLEVSDDGTQLYAASSQDGSITTYDLESGKQVRRIEKIAGTLVWFVVAPSP